MRTFVLTDSQVVAVKFGDASTTAVLSLAQLMVKANGLVRCRRLLASNWLCGSHSEVWRPQKVGPQPVIPGK